MGEGGNPPTGSPKTAEAGACGGREFSGLHPIGPCRTPFGSADRCSAAATAQRITSSGSRRTLIQRQRSAQQGLGRPGRLIDWPERFYLLRLHELFVDVRIRRVHVQVVVPVFVRIRCVHEQAGRRVDRRTIQQNARVKVLEHRHRGWEVLGERGASVPSKAPACSHGIVPRMRHFLGALRSATAGSILRIDRIPRKTRRFLIAVWVTDYA